MASEPARIRLKLAYDGTDFIGWQKQPGDPNSIQHLLESKLSQIYQHNIRVIASGRTDRGVHAQGQWVHFDLPDDEHLKDLKYKLNRMTPKSVAILQCQLAPSEFHAQISAISKCYRYRIAQGDPASPFVVPFAWPIKRNLNLKKLTAMAKIFLGEHDFSSFQSQGTPVTTPVREIFISRWAQPRPGILEYQIQGSGFLKQMVRNMVGTMIKLEEFQAPEGELCKILGARDRQLAAAPAPAQGLFLASVQYPRDLDNKCRKL